METKDETEENRREAALASNPCLQPNFRSESLTQSQISKFQELHKKRLQIKSKSNKHKKRKSLKSSEEGVADEDKVSMDAGPTDPTIPSSFGDCNSQDSLSIAPGSHEQSVLRTRQKLYWGLDVKERWERKSNM
ncbi:hypothetical protein MLD38_022788 [Melastoma candidum]|uniref:Uncharacterized protein n=1 Tax=Melastoma candidum TaxID=119954 RepID=A0ACB9QKG3_9MYRT|nr:hypothetical protein MLD38_022788 [Melastoma candidum]